MKRSSLLFTAGGLFVIGVAGCQAIAGIQGRTTDPLLTGCTLPSTGNGRVRLVDVASVAGNSDFCVRTSGTAWGRPVFRDGGNDALCLGTASQPGGLSYGQATVPFAVSVGNIDVKAIPAGQTCAAVGTSEADGIAVGDSTAGAPVVTLMRYGGGSSSAEGMSGLPEAAPGSILASDSGVRVVNALSGGKSIEWGFAVNQSLPTTIGQVVGNVAFPPGKATPSTSKPGLAQFTSSGYAEVLPQQFSLAAFFSTDTTQTALTLYNLTQAVDLATFYVIGDPNDTHNLHPVTGLYCEDTRTLAGAGTYDAGTDAGGAFTAQDTSLLQQCTFAPLSAFSVDLVNTSLYGVSAPFENERKKLMPAAIAARTSDFMCLLEVDSLSDRTAIAQAASTNAAGVVGQGQFPYSYLATTDQNTPPTNPADVKTPYTTAPPCTLVSSAVTNKVYTCVESNCSTVTGGDPNGTGVLNESTECLSADCTLPFAPLYNYPLLSPPLSSSWNDDYCFACIALGLISQSSISQVQSSCAQASTPPVVYAGQTPMMILSHYPIVANSTFEYTFPSTGYHKGILKAQMQVENNKVIDFFCGELSSPFIDSSLPYFGQYGSDLAPDGGQANGWEEEQDLQATEAVTWIQQQIAADNVPAIIALDLHADDVGSSAVGDGGLTSVSPEVVDAFNAVSSFAPAIVEGATPMCDYCPAPQNPYNGSTPSYEFLHTYLAGFPENATQSETYWGTDNTAVTMPPDLPSYEPPPPNNQGPLLEYYGHNYAILRP